MRRPLNSRLELCLIFALSLLYRELNSIFDGSDPQKLRLNQNLKSKIKKKSI